MKLVSGVVCMECLKQKNTVALVNAEGDYLWAYCPCGQMEVMIPDFATLQVKVVDSDYYEEEVNYGVTND